MSPTPRISARAVRLAGAACAATALTLGVAGTASACSIRDFSAEATCTSDGHGIIRVTDKDASGTPADITLYIKMSAGSGEEDRTIGTKHIDHPTGEGVSVDFAYDWAPGTQFRVRVKASDKVDEDIKPDLTTPDKACAATSTSTPSQSTTPKPTPSASAPTKSATPTPSAPTSSAAAPAPANSASPAGDSNLAETGASSNTGLIAGIAAALVVAGGGVVFALRKRGGAKS
ncbi:LAETG motif-containing sortase-dependent surface protein [Streptomyces sp. VRA16 Mangrove soil]|uniref:LAETG motif-containing sortase-dependent surface protein n=1 Tax=Streptomyces sp. VRA16 Mangrove soil TaxID=2817434 RepID=UPI001A9E6DAA|nr:LAETG motif-containing sortase-dependent surface protein [Streptomyces sp. VRA16 Mangrove soil]MBO1335962.1 LPXTG cell wall anchor domain-containing protein [Streptomyces sp. VRA16 Mangrove soil]